MMDDSIESVDAPHCSLCYMSEEMGALDEHYVSYSLYLYLYLCLPGTSAAMLKKLRDTRNSEGSPYSVATIICPMPIHFCPWEPRQSKVLVCQLATE